MKISKNALDKIFSSLVPVNRVQNQYKPAKKPIAMFFWSRATRLYTPLCRSVRLSVGPSVRPSHFTFFGFCGI